MNSNSLVFLDESRINTDFTRLYGRGKGKSRVWDKTPLNTPKSTTLFSSVRLDGEMICGYFQGPLTGDIFCSYVQEHMVPHLRKGDIVVMDNLPTHKVSGVREAIEAAGASVLYLPPYSPDFNPKGSGRCPNKQKLRFPAAPGAAASSLCGYKDTACKAAHCPHSSISAAVL